MKISIEDYISERLENQITWYDKKAINYKKCSNTIYIFSILVSSSSGLISILPLVTKLNNNIMLVASSTLSIIVAVSLSISKIKKFDELHSTYRMTCEKLKSEKYLYLTSTADYDCEDLLRDKLLVSRIESLLSTEVGNWAQLNEKKESDN